MKAKAQMERNYDVLAAWRERADDLDGQALACGHSLAQEPPGETAGTIENFFPTQPVQTFLPPCRMAIKRPCCENAFP
jgi:hypothetical protein